MKHTKIVATISDIRCDVDFIKDLYLAGMNVVRMNSAHMDEEGFARIIGNTRSVSNKIGILMDTKGPEIRTTKTTDGEPIQITTGDKIKVIGNPDELTSNECIAVSYPNIVADLSIGFNLLFDDGEIDLKVIEKTNEYLL